MVIGYARVSTVDQKLDLQNDALTKAGCERIFTDTAGGAGADRTGLEQALTVCSINLMQRSYRQAWDSGTVLGISPRRDAGASVGSC